MDTTNSDVLMTRKEAATMLRVCVADYDLFEHQLRKHVNKNTEHLNSLPETHTPMQERIDTWG